MSITAVSNNSRQDEFISDMLKLFQKHSLCIVPTYSGAISAHDPMVVTEFDSFWQEYFKRIQQATE